MPWSAPCNGNLGTHEDQWKRRTFATTHTIRSYDSGSFGRKACFPKARNCTISPRRRIVLSFESSSVRGGSEHGKTILLFEEDVCERAVVHDDRRSGTVRCVRTRFARWTRRFLIAGVAVVTVACALLLQGAFLAIAEATLADLGRLGLGRGFNVGNTDASSLR